MEVKKILTEYQNNGTKNLVKKPDDNIKTGPVDSKELAQFLIDKVGGAQAFKDLYNNWATKYTDSLKQAANIDYQSYTAKDKMVEAAKSMGALSGAGKLYNYVNTALGGQDISEQLDNDSDYAKSLMDGANYYSQWETAEDYNKYKEEFDKFSASKYAAYTQMNDPFKFRVIKDILDNQKKIRDEEREELFNNSRNKAPDSSFPLQPMSVTGESSVNSPFYQERDGISEGEDISGHADNLLYGITNKISDEEYAWLQEYFNFLQNKAYDEIGYAPFSSVLDMKKRQWEKMATEDQVGASTLSLYDNLFGAIPSFVGNTITMLSGEGIDANASWNEPILRSQTIRATIAQNISNADYENWQEKHPNESYEDYSKIAITWGDVGSFAYMTGMSFADSMLAAGFGAMTGGGQVVSLAIMGTAAASNTTLDKISKGYTNEQAFSLGIIAGAAEIITEKFSLDALFDKGSKGLGYVLKNFVVEGTEELGSDIINFAADTLIMCDQSEWSKIVQSHIDDGDDKQTAIWKSVIEIAEQWGADFLGGALCGGFAGGINSVFNYSNEKSVGQKIKTAGLTETVAGIGSKSLNHKIAKIGNQLQEYITNGTEISNAKLGSATIEIFNDVTSETANDISEALKRRGYSTNQANELGRIITLSITGQSESLSDIRTAIKDAKALHIVKTEVNTDRASEMGAVNKVLSLSDVISGVISNADNTAQTEQNIQGNAVQQADSSIQHEYGGIGAAGDVDNSGTYVYNNNGRGENYVATDEFRRLQAESQRMSDEDIQLYRSGDKSLDEELRNNLSRILQSQIRAYANGSGNAIRVLNLEGKSNQFNVYENVDGKLFHDVFEIARNYLKFGELVDLHSVETTEDGIGYNDCYNYLSEDGLSGFSITPDGDLISVFNASGKAGFLYSIAPVVREKAKTLDCYASVKQDLRSIYERILGFKTASVMDYNMEYDHDNIAKNHGNPQVAFMVNTEAEVETKEFSAEDYDAAVEYRNSYVDKAGVNDSAFSNAEDTAFDEPDLTDTSGMDPYERVVRRMNGEQFDRTPQHERVEQTAQKLGRKLYWDCSFGDGYIDSDGNIHLAPNTEDPIFKVFKHDLTHYLEKNERLYNLFANAVMDSQVFKDWVKSKGYNSTAEFAEAKKALYEEAEKERQRTNPEAPQVKCDNPDAEILADFVGEKLFGGEYELTDKLLRAMEEKPRRSFFEAVKDWFAKIKRAMLGTKEIKTIEQAEDAFIRTYKAVQQSVQKGETGGSVEYSYAGVNSRTADKSLLLKAQSMLDNGADSETVRKETGWFKGYDGKWRFEIDDSQAQFRPEGDVQLMKDESYRRLQELTDKWADDSLTEAETEEMDWLSEQFSDRVWEEKYRLDDYLDHPDLYDAYPMLRYTSLVFDDLPPGEKGFFNPRSNTIVLSRDLFGKQKNTLLHEIQHIIQKYEGFSKGSSPKYWNDRMESGYSKRDENGIELMSSELYKATAGEIEARDTASRADMTSEQRKNTRPDIDRTDVVFADGSTGIILSKDISEYPYNMQTVIKEYMSSVDESIEHFIKTFNSNNRFARHKISNVTENQATDIKRLLGIDVNGFTNDINTNAIRHIEKRHGKNGVADSSMSNISDIARIGYVLKNYDDVEIAKNGLDEVNSAEFRNSKNEPAPMLIFSKKINGTYYVAQAIPDSEYKKLWIVSAYISEKEAGTQALNTKNKSQVGMSLASSASDTTVSQKAQSVNSQYMQEGENYTEPNTDGSGVQYSISEKSRNSTISFDIYTEEQYNNFGWVRTNDVLSGTAFNLLIEKIAEIKTGAKFAKSRYGEYIIPVGNESGIYNILVYTDGNMESPNIRKVIEINTENDFLLSSIRSDIYDAEERKLYDAYWYVSKIYGTEDITQYKRNDCKSFRQYARERKRGTGEEGHRPGRIGQEGRRAPESAGAVNQYSTDDRADLNEESAFSLPENENKVPYSIPSRTAADLLDQYERGEITKEEYLARITKQRTETPGQIARLTPEDASTTPKAPEVTDDGELTGDSSFYENVREKSKFVNETVKQIITDDRFIKHYAAITNKETLQAAAEKLNEGGKRFVEAWGVKPEQSMTAEDIAVGLILIERYQTAGDSASAVNVMRKLRMAGTAAGQTVQAFSMLGRLDPATMQMYMQGELDSAYNKMVVGKTQKWIDENQSKFELTEEEMDYIRRRTLQAANATDKRTKDIAIAEILAMVSNKIPPEKGRALKALMRINMLFNLKTQVRNILGNAGMAPAFWASDLVGSVIDKQVAKKTGYRTKGSRFMSMSRAKAFKRGAVEAVEDFRLGIDTRQELDRFDIGQGKSFNDQHTGIASVINPVSKVLNQIDRVNSFILEIGDRPFFEYWFTNSLENQMRLNDVTEPTADMLTIAEMEALTRVWQDNNKFTESVKKFKNILNLLNINGYGLGDVFIKFVKTPANLTKAMVDFSPIGLMRGLKDTQAFYTALQTGHGNIQLMQYQMVKSLSNGIVGTLMYIAFFILAAGLVKGIKIKGESDDDDDVKNFEKNVLGEYPYTITFGKVSIAYDWITPIGSMIAASKAIVDATEKGGDLLTVIKACIHDASDVLLNQSFMFNISKALTDPKGWQNGIMKEIYNEPAVLIPQLMSQVANMLDDKSREMRQNNDAWQTLINTIKYKIPGLRETLEPTVDTLGREVDNPRGDFFNAFINPANAYSSNPTETSEEVYRLYESTGDAGVIYPKAPSSLEINKVTYTLTIKERNQYQTTLGKTADGNIASLMKLGAYKEMTDAERVDTIKHIYDYARNIAKAEYLNDDSVLTGKERKMKILEEDGIMSAAEYLMLTQEADTNGNGYLTEKELNAALNNYINDKKMRAFVKKLYGAKNDEIDGIAESYNN